MFTQDYNEGIFVEKQVRIPSFTMSYAHRHNYYELFYLRSGSCIYSVDNQHHHLSAGDLFLVYPGDSHSTQYEGLVACERIVVGFSPSVIPKQYLDLHENLINNLSRSGKVVFSPQGKRLVEDLLFRMLDENIRSGQYSSEILYLQLLTLLLTLQRDGIFVFEKMKPETISLDIEEVLQYIVKNFAQQITLEDAASLIHLTPTYFSHKFKKITGLTFKEYLNYIRIRQSCQMLIGSDDSITTIALNCGFNSSNYYKDCFRRIYGVSPREFRKRGQTQTHSFEFDVQNPYQPKIDIDSLKIL